VVLMDLRLPRLDGISSIRALQSQNPVPQALVLTAFYEETLISEALAVGACRYVLKQGGIEEFFAAIRATRPSQSEAPAPRGGMGLLTPLKSGGEQQTTDGPIAPGNAEGERQHIFLLFSVKLIDHV
jgi:DNA-binding NarL/FixJ family response regulator